MLAYHASQSSFCHTLKKGFNVGAAVAALDQRRDSGVRDCVHWEAVNKLVELLWRINVGNEARRNLSGDRSARYNATFLDELFRPGERRENDSFS